MVREPNDSCGFCKRRSADFSAMRMTRKKLEMDDLFEWNPEKAAINQRKHGVSFEEAETIFSDPFSLTIPDPLHSVEENRFTIIGFSD